MAAFLGAEWFEAAGRGARLADRPGASARLEVVVGGGPGGEVRSGWVLEDGAVREAAPGPPAAADVTLTTTWADAVRMQRGELDPAAAFMQGRLKAAGDMRRLLAVLPLAAGEGYRAWRDALTAATEF